MSYPDHTHIGDLPGCTCGPYWSIIPPEPCPYHSFIEHDWKTWPLGPTVPLEPEPMSDEEIDRIARRVAEFLKELL